MWQFQPAPFLDFRLFDLVWVPVLQATVETRSFEPSGEVKNRSKQQEFKITGNNDQRANPGEIIFSLNLKGI